MSKKYETLAARLVEQLGGKQNIKDGYHCQTRLRFKLADESKVDDQAVSEMDGVVKVIRNAGVYQVVIGTHVADVFEEVEKLIDIQSGTDTDTTQEKKKLVEVIIDFVAGVFQPVIPALSGAGMVKAVLALLVVSKIVTPDNQTYMLLNLFADGVFYFLPMILAWSFMDLVSTHQGYGKRYGLVYVDRDEKDLKEMKRVKKDSFYWYRKVIQSNGKTM